MLRKKKSTKANLSSEYWNVPENQSPVTISHKGEKILLVLSHLRILGIQINNNIFEQIK